MNSILEGSIVRLRPADESDIPDLVRIRQAPEVYVHWRGGNDMEAAVREDFAEPDTTGYVIELDGRVVGWVQWSAEEEPDYRHASLDIYVDGAVHGRGVGTDAVRVICRHLIEDHCHHRLTIDPPPTTRRRSAATPRWASNRSASPGSPSAARTARGTTDS